MFLTVSVKVGRYFGGNFDLLGVVLTGEIVFDI